MYKCFLTLLTLIAMSMSVSAKTLVVYYSYTNNVEKIVNELKTQIDCDVVEIQPAEKGLDYAANNYAIGSAQISAIQNNPDKASSYPAIDPVDINLDEYETVIIGAPLWWSHMAAPLQTFLFNNGPKMADKNIGLIVSSASSGISGVVADARRLIPEGKFVEPNLWIRSSQVSDANSLISKWLKDINYNNLASELSLTTGETEIEIIASDGLISVKGDCDLLSIFNLSGLKIFETTEKQVSTSYVGSGSYIAQACGGSRAVTRKINIK